MTPSGIVQPPVESDEKKRIEERRFAIQSGMLIHFWFRDVVMDLMDRYGEDKGLDISADGPYEPYRGDWLGEDWLSMIVRFDEKTFYVTQRWLDTVPYKVAWKVCQVEHVDGERIQSSEWMDLDEGEEDPAWFAAAVVETIERLIGQAPARKEVAA